MWVTVGWLPVVTCLCLHNTLQKWTLLHCFLPTPRSAELFISCLIVHRPTSSYKNMSVSFIRAAPCVSFRSPPSGKEIYTNPHWLCSYICSMCVFVSVLQCQSAEEGGQGLSSRSHPPPDSVTPEKGNSVWSPEACFWRNQFSQLGTELQAQVFVSLS